MLTEELAVDGNGRLETPDWTTGIIGGALLISGSVLLVIATLQHNRARADSHARLHPGVSGLEVRF